MTDETVCSGHRGPLMSGDEFISAQTCDRCLSGIKSDLGNISKEIGEVKDAIQKDREEQSRKTAIRISIVAVIVGLVSNLDKIGAIFR